MKLQPQSELNSAIREAQERGFNDVLFLNDEGDFSTHSNEIVPPIIIEIIQCHGCGATLFMVAGEGKRGTWVHRRQI